jgi:glycosyltransferase involved in cell wall biosynthesis
MRVAIITSGFLPVIDGVTVSGMHRLQRLSDWGHEVILFCPDYRSLEDCYPDWEKYTGNILPGIRVVNLPSTGFMGLDFERNVSFFAHRILLKELREFSPDIIHVDEPERLAMGFLKAPGEIYAKKHNIPCVCFYRTNFLDYIDDYFNFSSLGLSTAKWVSKKLLLFIYHAYDKTLVSSKVTYQKLIDMGFNNAEYRNLLGFDAQNFKHCSRQNRYFELVYGLQGIEEKVKLIFLGRLMPDKGWDFTLNAVEQFKDSPVLKNMVFLIAGDGPMREEIMTSLKQYTAEVYWLGRVAPENIPALLSNSDLHVTTSQKETRGLTVLEALASGIPVIAPQAGGVTENIRDGWNGYLFAPNDAADFWHKLEDLVNYAEKRAEMGLNGRESMMDYGWDVTVQNLVEVWQELIAQKPGVLSVIESPELKN